MIKKKSESRNDGYFREKILTERVIPFLNDPENVLMVGEAVFLDDKAPCMRAKATQQLLRASGIEFWGNDVWPGNSPDLNPAEHIGSIIGGRGGSKNGSRTQPWSIFGGDFEKNLIEVLESLEDKTDLFEDLLCSYPARLKAVREATGQHTDFWFIHLDSVFHALFIDIS